VAAVTVATFEVEKLSGAAELDGGRVAARLSGTASHRDLSALDAFLAKVLAEAHRVLASAIILDLRDVGYMNSSHFKSLVSWLGRVARTEPRLEVTLRANAEHHWQKRSLDALGHLAEGLVRVES
jgi:hypothetical protein